MQDIYSHYVLGKNGKSTTVNAHFTFSIKCLNGYKRILKSDLTVDHISHFYVMTFLYQVQITLLLHIITLHNTFLLLCYLINVITH